MHDKSDEYRSTILPPVLHVGSIALPTIEQTYIEDKVTWTKKCCVKGDEKRKENTRTAGILNRDKTILRAGTPFSSPSAVTEPSDANKKIETKRRGSPGCITVGDAGAFN